LKLIPLDGSGQKLDAALRGSLIHASLQAWAEALPHVADTEASKLLLAKGEQQFQPYMHMPEVQRFWWPRFHAMAVEFIAVDEGRRQSALKIHTEVSGQIAFEAAAQRHILTARADRIDVTASGSLRIVDYKSGSVPTVPLIKSGFAPQLTLEAAMAARGGFSQFGSQRVDDVIYISVGGNSKGVEVTALHDVASEAETALRKFAELLSAFQLPSTPYIPRHHLQKEDDISDYDHLSRRLEWQLQGRAL
jgi:ATP-dependent helicase/nuclease subunit B